MIGSMLDHQTAIDFEAAMLNLHSSLCWTTSTRLPPNDFEAFLRNTVVDAPAT